MNNITCENCESIYTIIFKDEDTIGTPEYCPFCGEIIEEDLKKYDSDDEIDESRWEE
jgi:hypothetical protein